MSRATYPLTLFYDAACPVCSLEMDHLRERCTDPVFGADKKRSARLRQRQQRSGCFSQRSYPGCCRRQSTRGTS